MMCSTTFYMIPFDDKQYNSTQLGIFISLILPPFIFTCHSLSTLIKKIINDIGILPNYPLLNDVLENDLEISI